LQRLIDKQVIIVNITQCAIGKVELRLFETGASLFDIGVLNGGDMSTEAAYCKLKILFSQGFKSTDSIKMLMQENLRGELTHSAYAISYEYDKNDPYLVDPLFHGDRKEGHQLDPTSIQSVVLRIKNIVLLDDGGDGTIPLHVKVYMNEGKEPTSDGLVGEFVKQITVITDGITAEQKLGIEAVNLELSDRVRWVLQSTYSQYDRSAAAPVNISLKSESGHYFTFESLQLTIFTRDNVTRLGGYEARISYAGGRGGTDVPYR
jgi:hypothetical protein